VCWHFKPRFESGPVTADLTTTVVHSYTLKIHDVNSVHSLYKQVEEYIIMVNLSINNPLDFVKKVQPGRYPAW